MKMKKVSKFVYEIPVEIYWFYITDDARLRRRYPRPESSDGVAKIQMCRICRDDEDNPVLPNWMLDDWGVQKINAFEKVQWEFRIGYCQIAKGMKADLVLLEQDPLKNIKHTKAIALVVSKGTVMTPEEILSSADRQ
ncbi:MAG: hypothetical protein ABGY96_15415 [bacterium]